MASMKMVLGAAAVVAGAAAGPLLKAKLVKREELFGMPTELVLGVAGVLAGLHTGSALLVLAGAGAAAAPAANKVLASLPGGTAIAGFPYTVGELPHGGAMYFPAPAHADNLANSVAGL